MHRISWFVLVAVGASACSSAQSAEDRYLDAIDKKLSGDQRSFYDDMMSLALNEPNTRAGRRARMVVFGESEYVASGEVLGVLAAVAVPNFLRFSSRAKQSEAKTVLSTIHAAQIMHLEQHGRYGQSFEECSLSADELPEHYIYFMGQDVLRGPETEDLHGHAEEVLADLELAPTISRTGFLAVAVGNIDGDDELDIWTIDQDGELNNVVSDL